MNDIDRDLFWLSFASNKGFGNKVKLGTTVNEHIAACLDEAKGTLKEVLAVRGKCRQITPGMLIDALVAPLILCDLAERFLVLLDEMLDEYKSVISQSEVEEDRGVKEEYYSVLYLRNLVAALHDYRVKSASGSLTELQTQNENGSKSEEAN